MKRFFTLFFSVLLVFSAFAQRTEGIIKKTGDNIPIIDGMLDDNGAWEDANVYDIAVKANGEEFTFGNLGETTWRALWNDDGIYIFLSTVDDAWYPSYISGGASYEYDKPEIYFDVNYILDDGVGPSKSNSGHYQIAPAAELAKIDGTRTTLDNGTVYAFKVNDPNWDIEYFVPFSLLLTKEGGAFDKTAEMGFDVTMIDRDPGDEKYRRATWANPSDVGESWVNMDDVGYVTLEGAEGNVEVEAINISVDGAITQDNQTLQIMLEVLPEDATIKTVKWKIKSENGGICKASISKNGVITPIIDETIVVQALSMDDFIYSDELTISITGQVTTIKELSYIKDGYFDVDGKASVVWDVPANAVVADGVLTFGPDAVQANQWDYHLLQVTEIPYELKDLDYIISFKAWAEEPRQVPLIIEDAFEGSWAAYGTSSDPNFSGKQWTIELTTTPTFYTLHANLGIMKETCIQNFNFQPGLQTPKIHIDSIYMVSVADMDLVSTAIKDRDVVGFKVYPNPVTNNLHIDLTTTNNTVAIYNSVGVKMEEVVVPGNYHIFDVSRYTKGLYFVKTNNAVVKFIK